MGDTDCTASGSDSGKKTECQAHSGTGPGEIFHHKTNKQKDLWPIDTACVYWEAHPAPMLLRSFLWACSKDPGVFHSLTAEVLGRAFIVTLLEYSAHFPGGSEVKASACSAEDLGSIPESGRSPRERNGNPFQYPCLENPMDRGAW